MTGVVATAIMAGNKAAISGLTPVFQSLASNKGLAANILENIGYQFPATSWLGYNLNPVQVQKIGNWGVGTATGYGVAWWVNEITNWFKELHLGSKIFDLLHPDGCNNIINDLFNAAQNWTPPRRDPLTLDLDGDGLETVGTNMGIVFDHDADGIKTGTGWVAADDGLLVIDKNGNGAIDNGRELFGDGFIKSNGQLAVDGFDALRDLDSNADGKVDASDARFAELKVWRDLNQDGLTQNGELFTLNQLGIAAINTGNIDQNRTLPNGNQIADLGTFIKTDGSSGTTGEVVGNMADINLADNPFNREFTDHLDTSAVDHLPDMQGSGLVRDLLEAATLSGDLATKLAAYAELTSRAEQQTQLDGLIKAWAGTSTMPTSIEQAEANGFQLIYLLPGQTRLNYDPYLSLMGSGSGSSGSQDLSFLTGTELQNLEQLRAQQLAITTLISTLERFNGETFVNVQADAVRTGAGALLAA